MGKNPSQITTMSSQPTKRRKINQKVHKDSNGQAPNWDLESEFAAKHAKKFASSNLKLPLKFQDGTLKPSFIESERNESDDMGDTTEPEDDNDHDKSANEQLPIEKLAPVESRKSSAELIKEAKEEMAKLATLINEEPEEHAAVFKALANFNESHIVTIRKLALVTQLVVYRDVIPGYRIRPAEEVPGEKISKEVRRIRAFEQSLIKGYRVYIDVLAKCAKLDPKAMGGLSGVALTCACTLLEAVPHFNFRSDILRIIVGKLSKRTVDESFLQCQRALQSLLGNDEDGNASMEAVSLLSKMIKARNFHVQEAVVNLFLHLRLLAEYAPEEIEEAKKEVKKRKQQKVFRQKRDRKLIKEQKALDRDMALVDAEVSHEERERFQCEILKLVFANYFKILKLRIPSLMGAVLEGLSKYAHLVNQDLFGDLLEAMKDLIRHAQNDEDAEFDKSNTSDNEAQGGNDEDVVDDNYEATSRNTSREALLCVVSAFTLLEGQHAAKARNVPEMDLPFFQNHLYQTLLPLAMNANLELTSRSLHLVGPDGRSERTQQSAGRVVNVQTTTVLLLRCLEAVLMPRFNARAVPAPRLAAFVKKLLTVSLQVPEKSALALLVLLYYVVALHGKKIAALWNTEETLGDGTYMPLASVPEASNPFTTIVWECELLRRHYCPEVRDRVKHLEKMIDCYAKGN